MTILKNLVLSRRIRKDIVLAMVDGMDTDGDGYISVREALNRIAQVIRDFSKEYERWQRTDVLTRTIPVRRWMNSKRMWTP